MLRRGSSALPLLTPKSLPDASASHPRSREASGWAGAGACSPASFIEGQNPAKNPFATEF
jgi:hypothetical protein